MLKKPATGPRRTCVFRRAKLPLLLVFACFCLGCGGPSIEKATAEFDVFLEAAREKLEGDEDLLRKGYSVFHFEEETYRIHATETAATPYTATMKIGVILPDKTVGFAEFEYAFENQKWVLTNSRNPSMPAEDWTRLQQHFTPPP